MIAVYRACAGRAVVAMHRAHEGSHHRQSEAMRLQDVVGEGVPAQDGENLLLTTYGELSEVPLSQPGVDAFDEGSAFVASLAGGAVHAPAPGSHARTIIGARREGIAAMLAAGRRAMHGNALLRSPLDVTVLGEAAVDEMAAHAPAEAL